jgi:hypothetical protein
VSIGKCDIDARSSHAAYDETCERWRCRR